MKLPHDNAIRLMLILLLAIFAPLAFYHRIRSLTSEKLDRWQEGLLILFGLRLSALPIAVGGLAWMINPQWMAWSSVAIPAWLRWLGIVCVGLTGSLVVWTFHNLGANLTDTVVTRRDHTLVTRGPYRYVRHPFYLAFALGVAGVSLAMANWFMLIGYLPVGFLVARTRIEEQKLLERFGTEYEDYMRRVGRFLPRWK